MSVGGIESHVQFSDVSGSMDRKFAQVAKVEKAHFATWHDGQFRSGTLGRRGSGQSELGIL